MAPLGHSELTTFFSWLFRRRSKRTAKLYIIGPLWAESTSDWCIPCTEGQLCGNNVHASCIMVIYHEIASHTLCSCLQHADIIKWKHFLHYWPFVLGIHQSLVNSPHKGQQCRALMFSLIRAWTNGWVNNQDTGDLRCHHAHCDVTVMDFCVLTTTDFIKHFRGNM